MLKCELIGNLGADAKVVTENGYSFVSFNVAHTDKWRDNEEKLHESTQWISCILNDVNAPVVQYLIKGKQVFVRGRVSLRCYSSEKARAWVAGMTVKVSELELLGGGDKPSQDMEETTKTGEDGKPF